LSVGAVRAYHTCRGVNLVTSQFTLTVGYFSCEDCVSAALEHTA